LLEHKVLPDDFWPAVDSLATRTTAIFLPLLNILNYFDTKSKDGVDLLKVFDGIHKLIAHAAYYSVCMRRSSTSLFFITSAYPGGRRDNKTEREASPELYQKSVARANRDAETWEAERAARQQQWKDLPEATAAALNMRLETAAHYRTRGSKVKFAVWPRIVRWRPENLGQPVRRMRHERLSGRPKFPPGFAERHGFVEASSQAEVESGEGQRVVSIGRAMVVYYQGFIFPRPAADADAEMPFDTKMTDDCCAGPVVAASAEAQDVNSFCEDLDNEVLDDGPRLLTYIENEEQRIRQRRNLHWRWLRLVAGLALGVCTLLYHKHLLQALHAGLDLMPAMWSRVLEFVGGLGLWMLFVPILLATTSALTRRLLVGVTVAAAVSWIVLLVKDGTQRLPTPLAAIVIM
jgi:hypothetical protein